jgi:glycosyltransferase involved in cell wall biosynthesis
VVLNNGCEDSLFSSQQLPQREAKEPYAVTVGTSPYKRLDLALEVFGQLQARNPNLHTLKIVGDKRQIPSSVLRDYRVEALGSGLDNDVLYQLLRGAEYYVSTSGIENSSTAVSEGLLLSKKVVLSDIPSHREAIKGLAVSYVDVPSRGAFVEATKAGAQATVPTPSWSDVITKLHEVAAEAWLSLKQPGASTS